MKQVKHTVPMLRIVKLDNPNDAFTNCMNLLRMGARSIIAEVKLDGLSCDLTYRDGQLECGTIRGESIDIGYDITDVVRRLTTVPKQIQHQQHLAIRGVLVLPIQVLMDFGHTFIEPDVPKSCVRAALDYTHPCHELLEFVMADHVVVGTFEGLPDTHKLIREFVHTSGSRVNCLNGFTETDFRGMVGRANSIKLTNRYDSCGLIFKIRNMLPHADGAEYYSGMFNVPEVRRTSRGLILDGWWSTTKSGKLVPYISVREDSRTYICNLHNQRNAIRCIKHIGDTILVDRRGDSTPIARGLVEHNPNGKPFLLDVKHCPACQQPTEVVEQDPYCVNPQCAGRNMGLIRFVLGRAMLNVQRVNDEQIEHMWRMVQNTKHPIQIAMFKVPSCDISMELHSTLQRYLVMPLHKALAMLNLPSLSLITLKNITPGHTKLASVFLSADKLRNDRERGILQSWWSVPENRQLVYRMDRFFVYGTPSAQTYDKNVCITGRFDMPRALLIRRLNQIGFGVHGSLVKHTDIVLAGMDAGNIVAKAEERKIPVVTSLAELKLM